MQLGNFIGVFYLHFYALISLVSGDFKITVDFKTSNMQYNKIHTQQGSA